MNYILYIEYVYNSLYFSNFYELNQYLFIKQKL